MKHSIYLFLSIFLFSGCIRYNPIKKEVLLNQTDIERIVERVEVIIFLDGCYPEDRVFKFDNTRGVVQNKTIYKVKGYAEYFYSGGSEGFIPYALMHKDGYLDFDKNKKNYCVEIVRDKNIIIDKHYNTDTIRGFVNYKEQKVIMKMDDYNTLRKSEDGKRVVLYYYE